jgi:hypothetical protein
MKRSGVYKLYVGKSSFYIGSSNDADYRRACHVTMLRKGVHPNPKMQAAWDAEPENVRITVLRPLVRGKGETVQGFLDKLRALEQELLDHYKGDERLVNLSMNSRGPDTRVDMKAKWRDPVFREKMLSMLKKRGTPSVQTRSKMSEAKKGLLNPKSRPVQVVWPDGRIECFPSGAAAAGAMMVSQQLLHSWLKGISPTPQKGKWNRHHWLVGVAVSYAD